MMNVPKTSSKRPRTPDSLVADENPLEVDGASVAAIERSPKVARSSSPSLIEREGGNSRSSNEIPLAPQLKDFLAPGGVTRFRPRPEWYAPETALPTKPCFDPSAKRNAESSAKHPTNSEEIFSFSVEAAPTNGLLPDDAFPNFSYQATLQVPASLRRVPIAIAAATAERSPGVALPTPPTNISGQQDPTEPSSSSSRAVFGKDWDHALHAAIRCDATDAALLLMEEYGVSINVQNLKQMTPLILAAQKGNIALVRFLLNSGADPSHLTATGMSALLQAAHFGHVRVMKLLLQHGSDQVNLSNLNGTTPLMRASQEGHLECVRLLLQANAWVNRRNHSQLTALMLASQRGHSAVCRLLLQHGADVDAQTQQNATSLTLACRRGQVEVARELVMAGCELEIEDSRGRTVRHVAARFGRRRSSRDEATRRQLLALLSPSAQIELMRRQGRARRSWEVIRVWHLLQKQRAHVLPDQPQLNIHAVVRALEERHHSVDLDTKSTRALIRTMTLPEPLVESIAQFLPLPYLWVQRIGMLYRRIAVSTDGAVTVALDLLDEILEEGGFLEACDAARVTPMPHFTSWADWKARARQRGVLASSETYVVNPTTGLTAQQRNNITTATCAAPSDLLRPSITDMRRHAGYLQILAHRSPMLQQLLALPPYNMSIGLITRLVNVSDVASLNRRMGRDGIHFDFSVAIDLVSLVSSVCSWYWRERDSYFGG